MQNFLRFENDSKGNKIFSDCIGIFDPRQKKQKKTAKKSAVKNETIFTQTIHYSGLPGQTNFLEG